MWSLRTLGEMDKREVCSKGGRFEKSTLSRVEAKCIHHAANQDRHRSCSAFTDILFSFGRTCS